MNQSTEKINFKKKKILHLLNTLNYSGAEVMLSDAYSYFNEKKYEQHVLSIGGELGPYAKKLSKDGFILSHIPLRKSILYFIEMFKFFKKGKFDVVQIHASHVYFLNVIIIKFANTKSKIFRTYHDVFHECSTYFLYKARIQYFICRNLLGIKGIAIGDSVNYIEKKIFKNPTTIVNNWIDESKFRPPSDSEIKQVRAELNIKQDAFVILTVGTCNAKKCHNDIFYSVQNLKDKIPDIVFLHRGTGEDLEKEKKLVKLLGIEQNVMFLEYIDFLPKIFWAADCFILASKREGLGDVIIEAIACKLPVILYDGYGMNDFKPKSESENYGYWINASKDNFNSYIYKIYEKKTKGELDPWKSNAHDFFKSKFSRLNSLEKLIELYELDSSIN